MRTHRVTVEELTGMLVEAGLLTESQATEVKVKSSTQRSRLMMNTKNQHQGRLQAKDLSPAEVIASFLFPLGGDEGA